ncbi:phosphodiesterase [Rhizobium oryzicola]|uniref:Phosphodiesterase n=1 Tax=Rhizobium oryzicola TaxID=1232668 RepID=A0ABT8T532_9HYPH|nr:phosphodiesterase [Rhizobium oryzicola]MDO1585514.1 phosphodiesterase [Rhizobium oryzicola]
MKIVHVTDIHLVPQPATLYGLDPRTRLDAAIDSIHADHLDADLIVLTGDLAHWGEVPAYEALRHRIDGLKLPVVMMVGNHDDRTSLRVVFPGAMDDGNGFVQGSRIIDGHRLVFLDTKQAGTHAGAYCDPRLAWLENELAKGVEPVLLFMHHPPFLTGISSMDAITQQDVDALWQVLQPHAQRIRHIFLGHVHRPISGNWHGISFSLIPGLNHQVPLVLDPHGENIPGSHEPPAYAVVSVEDRSVVVHLKYFLDGSKRFPLDGYEVKGRGYALGFPTDEA